MNLRKLITATFRLHKKREVNNCKVSEFTLTKYFFSKDNGEKRTSVFPLYKRGIKRDLEKHIQSCDSCLNRTKELGNLISKIENNVPIFEPNLTTIERIKTNAKEYLMKKNVRTELTLFIPYINLKYLVPVTMIIIFSISTLFFYTNYTNKYRETKILQSVYSEFDGELDRKIEQLSNEINDFNEIYLVDYVSYENYIDEKIKEIYFKTEKVYFD